MVARTRNRIRPTERGTTLIEFALVLPILLVLTLAALDLSRAFLAKNVLHQAAREGVRMRVVMLAQPSSDDISLVEQRVRDVAESAGLVPSAISVSSVPDAGMDTVSVTAPFSFTFPGLFRLVGVDLTNPMPLTASCSMKQE
jgi:Flp pilus assembly protein TadG